MKHLTRFLLVLLIFQVMIVSVPQVAFAAETLPQKITFDTDGAFSSGTDGLTFASGTLEVSGGMLKMTEKGTEKPPGRDEYVAGTQLYYGIDAVTSGTLVFETDFQTSGPQSGNCLAGMYDSDGNEVLLINFAKISANQGFVNGDSSVRITNPKWDSADNTYGFKFEVDLDRSIYNVYMAKTQTDGVWNWGNPLKYTNSGEDFTGFAFMNSVTNVAKIRFGLYQVNAGIDNFKVYKKVTSAQTIAEYNLIDGGIQQADITFSPAADKPADLVWSSSNTSVATVDQDGLITATGKGEATVTVQSSFYKNIKHTYKVNVLEGATGLSLDKTEATLCVGDNVTVKVSSVPENTAYKSLVWSSSDTSVATVTADGVVTAVGKGSAEITAAAMGKGGAEITASAAVKVIKPITGLLISASQTSLSVGETASFSAVVTPADASDVTKKWRSGNHYVAKVDQNGVVTAVGSGTAEIYVTASGITASQGITVTNSAASSGRKPSLISFYTSTGYSFYDIADMEWAQAAVYSAVELGVINPDGETTFGAKRNIKRDEFVSVVVKTLGLSAKVGSEEAAEAVKSFTDVPEENPHYAEVMKALELGIIQGVSDTQFAPDDDITRQDMAVVITNAFKAANVKTEEGRLDFADKDTISEYAQTAVRILSKMGIIVGKGENTFDPLANTTRAEVCVIVDRINAAR